MPNLSPVRDNPVCSAKRYYTDECQARAAALDSLDRFAGVEALWVYNCPHCPGWHLTKHPGDDKYKVTL